MYSNGRERISVDNDYSTDEDGSTIRDSFSHGRRASDNFDQMEMMEIEMTFGGGKRDNIVVLWGDDAMDLALKFVRKHNLKASAISTIANHISTTIEQFKNSTSNITMQSPSLDDRDDSVNISEYDDVVKQQQSNRDISIQNTMHHEPLDLPSESNTSTSDANNSQDNSHVVSQSTAATSIESTPIIPTPSTLLNLWADANDLNDSSIMSPTPQHNLNLSRQDDSYVYTMDEESAQQLLAADNQNDKHERDHEIEHEHISPHASPHSSMHKLPTKPPRDVSSLSPSSSSPAGGVIANSSSRVSTPELQELNISPIRQRGGLSRGLSDDLVQRPARPPSISTRQASHVNENKNSNANNLNISSRKLVHKSSFSSSPNASATHHHNAPSPAKKSSADMYNKLRQEWTGGVSNAGRRKSMAMSASSSTPVSDPLQQQYASISGIKQRTTLVVSKSVGGALYGASVRQPSSGDSESSSQNLSSPMKNRLYDDAFTQSKRREMLRVKAEKEEQMRMEENAFRMPKGSKKLTENLIRKDDHLPVGDRLHKEAAVIIKTKTDTSERWAAQKENVIRNWSCLQCGTYNDVQVGPFGFNVDQSKVVFTCISCKSTFDLNSLQESMFRPTNVALMNGTMTDSISSRRVGLSRSVHDYLHANVYLESKKLQQLKEAWEDEDEILTFRPIIPESSKEILRQYQRGAVHRGELSLPDDHCERTLDLSGQTGAVGDRGSRSKMAVAEMGLESYLTLPPTERLSKTETLCRVANPGENEPRVTKRSKAGRELVGVPNAKMKQLSESKKEDLFNRLTYEYIEKDTKLELARKDLGVVDPSTGRQFFRPTVGAVPSTVYSSAPVFSSEKKETIFDKLLRKGAEAKERAKLLKDKVLKKEKNDIDKNFSQPLPKSTLILKESSEQCIEEIFKLLIANQLFFRSNEATIVNASATGSPEKRKLKMTSEFLNGVSDKLNHVESLSLDVRTIDPNLVVEEVQHLLTDLRQLGLENASKMKEEGLVEEKGGEIALASPAGEEPDSCYLVSFEQFKSMIRKCTARRAGGIGRSYIYTPKPRDTAVQEMIQQETRECTFRPMIDIKSQALAMKKNRGEVPIGSVLNNEAELREQRLQHIKSLVEWDKSKECTFKPVLYPTPGYIVPTYRGQRRELQLPVPPQGFSDKMSDFEEEEDDMSVMTASTCSTTVKPATPLNANTTRAKDRAPTMRLTKQNSSSTAATSTTVRSNPSLDSLFLSTNR